MTSSCGDVTERVTALFISSEDYLLEADLPNGV